ncbi:MAG: hypothetical protein N2323_05930 [candidate division WOR-3 bacterium]|nr:hypothetical protein [candidate division WOR-3 bacterium]MCX7837472.1 hypothetical protein [candidate division WOR-3 bacterium]MDW8114225.1 hypothetical protein [candidate division WOR-3 bacterium]
MKKKYFKYFILFLFFFLFSLLLPGPNGLIQYTKRRKEIKKLEREILYLKIELAIKKLKGKVIKSSLKNLFYFILLSLF